MLLGLERGSLGIQMEATNRDACFGENAFFTLVFKKRAGGSPRVFFKRLHVDGFESGSRSRDRATRSETRAHRHTYSRVSSLQTHNK